MNATASEGSTQSDSSRNLGDLPVLLLREALDIKNILVPHTRKRSLLVTSGHSDMFRLREVVSITVAILDKMSNFAQIVSAIPRSLENFDEDEIANIRSLLSHMQE